MQDEFESATQDAQQAGAKAKASAGTARDEMRRTAEDVQEQFASAARTAKEQLGDAADTIKHKARAMADDQTAAGADQLSGLARAINMAADQMEGELPQAAGYVREAAVKVDNVSTMIRERSIEDLMHEANGFARANPVAFFGISLAAGIALARFLKSGQPARRQHLPASHSGHAEAHPLSELASSPATAPSTQF